MRRSAEQWRCDDPVRTRAIGGSRKSPPGRSPAAAAGAGHQTGDAPEPDLFLEDLATIQADAGIGSAAAAERFSARCSRDRRSATGRPTSRGLVYFGNSRQASTSEPQYTMHLARSIGPLPTTFWNRKSTRRSISRG